MTLARAPEHLASTPLGSLDLVVIDTETTGLDTTRARVIEIGAVRIEPARQGEPETFSMLVDPGIPIPVESTSIHGITDRHVDGVAGFAEVMGEFERWAGPCLMLGYTVGYDLSVLRAEHARAGLPWSPPRTLDVQELAQLTGQELPDWSLETVADWLGINMENRHRALPDALLTARVFTVLAPLLRSRGIMTFAEAERACTNLVQRYTGIERTSPARPAETISIDSYPFRNRVGDLMTEPPVMLDASAPVSRAIGLMMERGLGSLFLDPDKGGAYGIITERDILHAVHDDGSSVLGRPAGDYCSRPLITVSRKEFVYRAIITMSSRGIRHLGVRGDDGVLVGAISSRDLFKRHAGDAVALGREIDAAGNAFELGRVWSGLTAVVRALVNEGVDARNITAIISRELRALTKRACEIAESELIDESGQGLQANYAMMVLGSGGRGESMLAMDQDNAIVYHADDQGAVVDQMLGKLGQRVAEVLDESGVRYCPGGIMASNSSWRKSMNGWRQTVSEWLERTSPDDIMHADIFFDSMPVHGDLDMATTLRSEAVKSASRARTFLHLMESNACNFQNPLGWMGRWKLDRGRIDLKIGGIMPIFSAARAVSLGHAIYARSTADRLRDIKQHGVVADRMIDDLLLAHGYLLDAIVRQQLRDLEKGIPLSNRVAPNELDGGVRQQLKWALEQVPRVADLVGKPSLM